MRLRRAASARCNRGPAHLRVLAPTVALLALALLLAAASLLGACGGGRALLGRVFFRAWRPSGAFAPPAHHVLPDVAQLLDAHRLQQVVHRAVGDAAQHHARLAVGAHHCHKEKARCRPAVARTSAPASNSAPGARRQLARPRRRARAGRCGDALMTGVFGSSSKAMRSISLKPSMSGICTSLSTRSKRSGVSLSRRSAAFPPSAVVTE